MNKINILLLLGFFFLSFTLLSCNDAPERETAPYTEYEIDTPFLVNHFQTTLSIKAKALFPDSGKLGLGGGVDGFMLRKAFPGLRAKDFVGVIAEGGEYLERGDTLYYNGNAASVSPRINKEGFQTLMFNVVKRKRIQVNTLNNVEDLVSDLLK